VSAARTGPAEGQLTFQMYLSGVGTVPGDSKVSWELRVRERHGVNQPVEVHGAYTPQRCQSCAAWCLGSRMWNSGSCLYARTAEFRHTDPDEPSMSSTVGLTEATRMVWRRSNASSSQSLGSSDTSTGHREARRLLTRSRDGVGRPASHTCQHLPAGQTRVCRPTGGGGYGIRARRCCRVRCDGARAGQCSGVWQAGASGAETPAVLERAHVLLLSICQARLGGGWGGGMLKLTSPELGTARGRAAASAGRSSFLCSILLPCSALFFILPVLLLV